MEVKRFLLTIGMAALILLASCEAVSEMTSPDYESPTAVITLLSDDLPGLDGRYDLNEATLFSASATTAGDEEIVSYSWDFGDGSSGEGVEPSHQYGASGTYTLILTVTDAMDMSDEDSLELIINDPPEASISLTQNDTLLYPEDLIYLDGSGSSDEDGTVEDYSWDWGDGTVSAGSSVSHSYETGGDYTVTLTVTDDRGTTDTAQTSLSIEYANLVPEADAGEDRSIDYNSEGSLITLDGSGSSDSDGTIISYEWSFDSLPAGSVLSDSDISQGESASFDISGESEAAMNEGSLTYKLTLTVTDDDGDTDSDSVSIIVNGTGSVVIGIE
ncbi:MAG: PKD domain-containing protein [Spirochaetales bacterium]|nr:PKD domain-containing protein [Spirochaetales bacterium]